MSTPITTPSEAFLIDTQEAQTAIHENITPDIYWLPVTFIAEYKLSSIVWYEDRRYVKITGNPNNTTPPDLNTTDWKELDLYMKDTVLTPGCVTTPLLSTTNLILPNNTNGVGAVGVNSVSYGTGSLANNNNSMALGRFSQATGSSSTAVGRNSQATDLDSTALGVEAKATNVGATSIGRIAQATGNSSTAVGYLAQATATESTAVGKNSQATGLDSTALGVGAKAGGVVSTALGTSSFTSTAENGTIRLGVDASGLTALKCRVALTVTSDERDKANIQKIEEKKSIDFLKLLNPIRYNSDSRINYIKEEKIIEKRSFKRTCEKTGEEINEVTDFERDARPSDAYDEVGNLKYYDKDLKSKNSKCSSIVEIGLSAQQVEKSLEEVFGDKNFGRIVSCTSRCGTTGNPTGVKEEYSSKGIAYQNLIPFLIQGFQAQQREIENLKQEIHDLKNNNK